LIDARMAMAMMSIGFAIFAIAVFVWASFDYNRFIKFWMLRSAPYTQRVSIFFSLVLSRVCGWRCMAPRRHGGGSTEKATCVLFNCAGICCRLVCGFLSHGSLCGMDEPEVANKTIPCSAAIVIRYLSVLRSRPVTFFIPPLHNPEPFGIKDRVEDK